MTGVAWGQYQDYLNGEFDGKNHWDQAQKTVPESRIMHGGNKDIPYMSPGEAYGRYLTVGVKRALDAGAQAIYLEEPEFWAAGGYEANFQREWQAYYHEPWQRPIPRPMPNTEPRSSSTISTAGRSRRSSTLSRIWQGIRPHDSLLRATHSLLNYAHWRIVSPESSLLPGGGGRLHRPGMDRDRPHAERL